MFLTSHQIYQITRLTVTIKILRRKSAALYFRIFLGISTSSKLSIKTSNKSRRKFC